MEKTENDKKNYELAKLWNEILSNNRSTGPTKTDKEKYVNLENYAFRMNFLISNTLIKNKPNAQDPNENLVEKCNDFILKKSNLNNYLTSEKQRGADVLNKSLKNLNLSQECVEVLDNSLEEKRNKQMLCQ